MADPKARFGSTEIEILRYVGDRHPVTVGEVALYMAEASGQARTTVLTTMERLRKKGCLTRKAIDGVFRYSPKVPKAVLLKSLVKTFVDQTLGGSLSPFVSYLADAGPMSKEDLAALRRVVRELEQHQEDRP